MYRLTKRVGVVEKCACDRSECRWKEEFWTVCTRVSEFVSTVYGLVLLVWEDFLSQTTSKSTVKGSAYHDKASDKGQVIIKHVARGTNRRYRRQANPFQARHLQHIEVDWPLDEADWNFLERFRKIGSGKTQPNRRVESNAKINTSWQRWTQTKTRLGTGRHSARAGTKDEVQTHDWEGDRRQRTLVPTYRQEEGTTHAIQWHCKHECQTHEHQNTHKSGGRSLIGRGDENAIGSILCLKIARTKVTATHENDEFKISDRRQKAIDRNKRRRSG